MREMSRHRRLPPAEHLLEEGVLQLVADEGLDADVVCHLGQPQTPQKILLLSSLVSVAW
jgi:hypothetical protein